MRLALAILVLLVAASFAAAGRPPEWVLTEKFLNACQIGDVEAVARYLKLGVSPNARDKFGMPAIMRAARSDTAKSGPKTTEVLKLLVGAGADVNAVNEFGSNALFLIPKRVSPTLLAGDPYDFLIAAKVDARQRDRCGRTVEQREDKCASETFDDSVWRHLIEGGINIRSDMPPVRRHKNSATFAMGVAYYGESYQQPLKFLATSEVDSSGETSLFYLAARGRFNVGELQDIDPKVVGIKNRSGETALIRAAKFDSDFLAARLLGAGADATVRDKVGMSALGYAVDHDYYLTTLVLLAKSDPNAPALDGVPPIVLAVRRSSGSAVAAFVFARLASEGLAEQARNSGSKSDTALAQAYSRINVDQTDRQGTTPLIAAVEAQNTDIVGTLMRLKPNVNAADRKGRTAVSIARESRNTMIQQLLASK